MTTSRYIMILVFLSLFGCKKEKTKEEALQTEYINEIPNESDIKFEEGLKFMQKEQFSEAAKSIQAGIAQLNQEVKRLNGEGEKNLHNLTSQLEELTNKMEKGEEVQINKVRKLIARAEIMVHHSYLGTDDVLVWEDPAIQQTGDQNRFNKTLSYLKKEEKGVGSDIKKEHLALLAEGQKLNDEHESWNERIKEYNRKTNEYFKRHYPEYYMEKIGVYPND